MRCSAPASRCGGRPGIGDDLLERIVAGGFPPALARPTARRRANWQRDYVETLVQRDVRDMARIAALDALPRLLAAAAAQTARLFNLADLAAPFRISRPTIGGYVELLERLFLLERLPAWHSNRLRRHVKSPKLHFGDTGLAAALLGADAAALQADRKLLGQFLETFVYQELRRQASWHAAATDFFHFRDRDGMEVDIVVEQGHRAVAGLELKAAATVSPGDFRGLRKLASAAGDRFACGVVVYDGEVSARFGDRLYAVPIPPPVGGAMTPAGGGTVESAALDRLSSLGWSLTPNRARGTLARATESVNAVELRQSLGRGAPTKLEGG